MSNVLTSAQEMVVVGYMSNNSEKVVAKNAGVKERLMSYITADKRLKRRVGVSSYFVTHNREELEQMIAQVKTEIRRTFDLTVKSNLRIVLGQLNRLLDNLLKDSEEAFYSVSREAVFTLITGMSIETFNDNYNGSDEDMQYLELLRGLIEMDTYTAEKRACLTKLYQFTQGKLPETLLELEIKQALKVHWGIIVNQELKGYKENKDLEEFISDKVNNAPYYINTMLYGSKQEIIYNIITFLRDIDLTDTNTLEMILGMFEQGLELFYVPESQQLFVSNIEFFMKNYVQITALVGSEKIDIDYVKAFFTGLQRLKQLLRIADKVGLPLNLVLTVGSLQSDDLWSQLAVKLFDSRNGLMKQLQVYMETPSLATKLKSGNLWKFLIEEQTENSIQGLKNTEPLYMVDVNLSLGTYSKNKIFSIVTDYSHNSKIILKNLIKS